MELFETKTEYHADTLYVSHSSLEVFRESIPLYHGRFITKEIPPEPATPAMELGKAVHVAILEPINWSKEIIRKPDFGDMRTNVAKDKFKEWQLSIGNTQGKIILNENQYEQVFRMQESVWENSRAKEYLERAGWTEKPLTWNCNETGILCKSRLDRFTDDGLVLDVKTASNPLPSEFPRTAWKYGYHRQAAFYRKAIFEATKGQFEEYVIIAVGSQPPYESVVYRLPSEEWLLGERENSQSMAELKNCVDFDVWIGRESGKVVDCRFPKYAFYE